MRLIDFGNNSRIYTKNIKFYDIEELKYKCRSYGRYASSSDFVEYLQRPSCNENMTLRYDVSQIKNWNDYVEYMELYLRRVVSWNPFYTGPLNLETTYILHELLQIIKSKIVPFESQPGFYIENADYGPYLQVPYIFLQGPKNEMQSIIYEAENYLNINYNPFFSLLKIDNEIFLI